MKKRISRILAIFIVLIIVISSLSSILTSAVTFSCNVKTYSKSIYMVNLDSGMVVFEKNATEHKKPAGLVKIMVFIIASEYYEDTDEKIEVKQDILDYLNEENMTISGLEDHGGDSLSIKDLFYNLIMTTGHDSALVLADNICNGDYDKFVSMMNDKAKELGLNDTHFTNVTGIDDDDQYTNCVDMYNLTKYAMTLPMFSKIANTATYYLSGDEDPIVTTNYLIDASRGVNYYYMYATGTKTTATFGAGRCLVSTGLYEGYSYMIVSMDAPYDLSDEDDEEWCMLEAADLYRWAFLKLKFVTQVTTETPVCEQKVLYANNKESILLVPENDLNIVLPADYSESDVSIVPDKTNPISAPISKGQFITTATVLYKGEPFTSIRLVAQDDVKVSPIMYTTDVIKSVLSSMWFLIAVGIIVVLFVLYVLISQKYSKEKEREKPNKEKRSPRSSTRKRSNARTRKKEIKLRNKNKNINK